MRVARPLNEVSPLFSIRLAANAILWIVCVCVGVCVSVGMMAEQHNKKLMLACVLLFVLVCWWWRPRQQNIHRRHPLFISSFMSCCCLVREDDMIGHPTRRTRRGGGQKHPAQGTECVCWFLTCCPSLPPPVPRPGCWGPPVVYLLVMYVYVDVFVYEERGGLSLLLWVD